MLEDYLNRVHGLLSSVASLLTEEERSEVWHLVNHDEPAEALRTLAWIVVEEGKRLPASAISEIRELSSGLVDEADLPSNLDDFAFD